MDDLENRRREMFIRAHGFGDARSADFGPTTLGGQTFTALGELIAELNDQASSQATGFGLAQQGTSNRSVTRQALRDTLRAISRTAEAIAQDIPGFDDPFRMPPGGNDQNLVHAARAISASATPVSAQFISHAMPADFLAELNSDIADFEAAINHQTTGVGTHISASASIDQLISDGLKLVKKLDAIVRNTYSNDPAALAEWTSASHTERGPRRTQSASPPSPTPPAPPVPPVP
jgi:hypothetical protein